MSNVIGKLDDTISPLLKDSKKHPNIIPTLQERYPPTPEGLERYNNEQKDLENFLHTTGLDLHKDTPYGDAHPYLEKFFKGYVPKREQYEKDEQEKQAKAARNELKEKLKPLYTQLFDAQNNTDAKAKAENVATVLSEWFAAQPEWNQNTITNERRSSIKDNTAKTLLAYAAVLRQENPNNLVANAIEEYLNTYQEEARFTLPVAEEPKTEAVIAKVNTDPTPEEQTTQQGVKTNNIAIYGTAGVVALALLAGSFFLGQRNPQTKAAKDAEQSPKEMLRQDLQQALQRKDYKTANQIIDLARKMQAATPAVTPKTLIPDATIDALTATANNPALLKGQSLAAQETLANIALLQAGVSKGVIEHEIITKNCTVSAEKIFGRHTDAALPTGQNKTLFTTEQFLAMCMRQGAAAQATH